MFNTCSVQKITRSEIKKEKMKQFTKGLLATGAALALFAGSAPANAYVITETSWNTVGLKEVVREIGQYSWSIDGLGTVEGTGDIQVNKPAGATVHKAYFMAAQVRDSSKPTLGSPSAVLLNSQAVTFDLESVDGGWGTEFNNYFADVTSLVQSTLDGASVGVSNIAVDEGGLEIEGTALAIIWNDSSVDVASIVFAFGNSDPAGDNFSLYFPALTTPQLEDLQMSVGDTYSYQLNDETYDSVDTQTSTITVNGSMLSDVTGGFDDCFAIAGDPPVSQAVDPSVHWSCDDDGLFTIGGVGDSSANPTIPTSGVLGDNPDDELYSISPFVSVGSTQIEVQTRNASNDDNVFFVGFNLKRVALTDAPTLANTGIDGSVTGTAGAIAVLAALVGAVALTARRRRA
jgi:hypothetical protein